MKKFCIWSYSSAFSSSSISSVFVAALLTFSLLKDVEFILFLELAYSIKDSTDALNASQQHWQKFSVFLHWMWTFENKCFPTTSPRSQCLKITKNVSFQFSWKNILHFPKLFLPLWVTFWNFVTVNFYSPIC